MIKSFEEASGETMHRVGRGRRQEPPLHPPIHAAIIMDGSGRWAEKRGLRRSAGHRAGVAAVGRSVEAAPGLGIGTLTLHAFSADNWQRPGCEVGELMSIFAEFLRGSVAEWVDAGIRTSVMGRRDRIEPSLVEAIEAAEAATRDGTGLHLRLAIDYSGREAIVRAARTLPSGEEPTPLEFGRLLGADGPQSQPVAGLDLLIRTGGERRLSDFMLWECAYAELVFTERLWPDFDAEDLEAAVREFHSRDRRFGRILESVPAET
jgi:undecaprenyl diphosphate synthase